MIKKTCISIMIFVGLILMSTIPAVAVDDGLTVTDLTGDVSQYNATTAELIGTYDVPNIDIKEVKAEKTGNSVTITMTMYEEGQIETGLESTYYAIVLITTSTFGIYLITYTGMDLSEYGVGSEEFFILNGNGELIGIDSSSVEDNIMILSFKLESSNERLIGLYAGNQKSPSGGEYYYTDEAPEGVDTTTFESLYPDAGGTYNASTNSAVSFQATLEEGSPEDYEWVWVFDETGTTLEGANPSHTFKIPDTYLGRVYVFDGEGNWGTDEFSVEVSGTTSNGENNGSPGFEMIIMFVAIAVLIGAIVIFKRK